MKKMMVFGILILSLVLIAGCQPQDASDTEVSDEEVLAGEAVRPARDINRGDIFSVGGEILEYNGADRNTVSNPKIRFKWWQTGETIEYSIAGGAATIRLHGSSYALKVLRPNIVSSPIRVDLDGDSRLDQIHLLSTLHYSQAGVYCANTTRP